MILPWIDGLCLINLPWRSGVGGGVNKFFSVYVIGGNSKNLNKIISNI